MKTHARVHRIDRALLEGVWSQAENRVAPSRGLAAVVDGAKKSFAMPELAALNAGGGFTLEFWVRFDELSAGQTLLDAREGGRGVLVRTTDRFTLAIALNDGQQEFVWDSDPGTGAGSLRSGVWQHVAAMVDGASRVTSFVVNGVFNDGGSVRDYGWGRFDRALGDVNGAREAKLAPAIYGRVKLCRVYNRYLRTSEAVGAWRAGPPE